jgi:membrane-bound inhibitor of C-type lysozyme
MRTLIALGALSFLAACSSWWPFSSSSGERPLYPPDATIYKCDGGKQLVVRYFEGAKYAMVIYPDREFRLDSVPAPSGARYSNGRTTLHTKESDAVLEEGGQTLFAECRSAPR